MMATIIILAKNQSNQQQQKISVTIDNLCNNKQKTFGVIINVIMANGKKT